MASGIYIILNTVNGKSYIGQASNFTEQSPEHVAKRIATRQRNKENRQDNLIKEQHPNGN
jgi:predicted GIY-YIG superfamily endonuclease